MNKPEDICSDFAQWPYRWMGTQEDVNYGKIFLDEMRPFINHLIQKGLKKKTIRNHMDNLWLLGGEIIRDVSIHNEYKTLPGDKLRDSIGTDGGPYCRHIESKTEERSFDSTCRKLHKYLKMEKQKWPTKKWCRFTK